MLLDELHARRDAIQSLCRRHGAHRIRVLGSVARREEHPDDDVDFPRGCGLLAQRMQLTDHWQRPIDP
ncbi:MAG: hypothetical protein Q8M05_14115 [Rhodoferax sp.]|uniref:nucleotidyltransferase family protein n=1 Tax=Rhodoferax sp. TaxID=50421 RepID=UPI00273009FC|nr:hypothetical protein [Rhodoferax sp.]MDP1530513.1 hypothetical protein [Rhodoferax sp.]